ncbi:unnamed protein product, partial [Prorocentrum cordatum]
RWLGSPTPGGKGGPRLPWWGRLVRPSSAMASAHDGQARAGEAALSSPPGATSSADTATAAAAAPPPRAAGSTASSRVRLVECGTLTADRKPPSDGSRAANTHLNWACTPSGQWVRVFSTSTVSLPNRERDKNRVEQTLGLSEFGDSVTQFYSVHRTASRWRWGTSASSSGTTGHTWSF